MEWYVFVETGSCTIKGIYDNCDVGERMKPLLPKIGSTKNVGQETYSLIF